MESFCLFFSELSLLNRLISMQKKPLIIPSIVHLIFMQLFLCKSLQCLVYLAVFYYYDKQLYAVPTHIYYGKKLDSIIIFILTVRYLQIFFLIKYNQDYSRSGIILVICTNQSHIHNCIQIFFCKASKWKCQLSPRTARAYQLCSNVNMVRLLKSKWKQRRHKCTLTSDIPLCYVVNQYTPLKTRFLLGYSSPFPTNKTHAVKIYI